MEEAIQTVVQGKPYFTPIDRPHDCGRRDARTLASGKVEHSGTTS